MVRGGHARPHLPGDGSAVPRRVGSQCGRVLICSVTGISLSRPSLVSAMKSALRLGSERARSRSILRRARRWLIRRLITRPVRRPRSLVSYR